MISVFSERLMSHHTEGNGNDLMYIYIQKLQIISEVLSCNYDLKSCSVATSKFATHNYGHS